MASPGAPTTADRRLAALFPGESPDAVAPWWRRRGPRLAAAAVAVAVVVSIVVAMSAFGSSTDTYRTATVAVENVDSLLTGVATIEPVAQATIAFPVSGTVASVNVHVGDTVVAGGTLASLDTQSLMQTLHQKQAALAQAQLTLDKALSGQSSGGSGGSGGSGASGASASGGSSATTSAARTGRAAVLLTAATPTAPPTSTPPSSTPPTSTPNTSTPPGSIPAAQQAVLAAQKQVDAAIAAANAALAAEQAACAAFVPPPSTTTTTAPTTTTPPDLSACQAAIAHVAAAQAALAAAQKKLADASNALDALLAQQAGSGGNGSGGSGGPGGGSGGSAGNGSSASRSGGGASPSAADLVADQAALDAAAAAVTVAQQNLDEAVIASPLAGTVVAVNLGIGQSVPANSSTANVVVQGSGGYEVSTTVGVDKIPSVTVGEAATVLPDGTHQQLAGKVVGISVAPASSGNNGVSYRVVVGLTNPQAKLDNGATGTVSILTKEAKAALAVPTSAVTTIGSRHTVTVLRGGTPALVLVQVGVVGNVWTQITGGLTAGEQVVLADMSSPLPNSATSNSNGTNGINTFGGAQFPGGRIQFVVPGGNGR